MHKTNLGNVNSVRVGRLATGKEVVIRCHPRGVVKTATSMPKRSPHEKPKKQVLPSCDTPAIHDYEGEMILLFDR